MVVTPTGHRLSSHIPRDGSFGPHPLSTRPDPPRPRPAATSTCGRPPARSRSSPHPAAWRTTHTAAVAPPPRSPSCPRPLADPLVHPPPRGAVPHRPPRRLHQGPPQQRRARLGDRQVLPPV